MAIENLLDPVVLMFAAGIAAGILRSEIRIPEALYETLSIFLLLAIGLKGGVELARAPLAEVVAPSLGTVGIGVAVPLAAFVVLRYLGRFRKPDAAAVAAHYGSVSAVTFAVAIAQLEAARIGYERWVPVLVVLLEIPAIVVGIALARIGASGGASGNGGVFTGDLGAALREAFLGKGVYLLVAGLLVGWVAGPDRVTSVEPLFFGLFHGALALFLLEMGLVASRRLADLKRSGPFLVAFGIVCPVVAGSLGAVVGLATGLSVGGTAVLATLAGSASYIAAPAAMRLAVPEANPTLYLTASLGVTFPFNIVLGIPLYRAIATWIHGG